MKIARKMTPMQRAEAFTRQVCHRLKREEWDVFTDCVAAWMAGYRSALRDMKYKKEDL